MGFQRHVQFELKRLAITLWAWCLQDFHMVKRRAETPDKTILFAISVCLFSCLDCGCKTDQY